MRVRFLFAAAFVLSSPTAFAESHTETGTAAQKVDVEAIKAEIRKDLEADLKRSIAESLREELKAEIKSELAAESAMTGRGEDDGWSDEEWKWEEPVKPQLNFLDFDGYFRFRYDFFHNLDLDTYFNNTLTGNESGPFSPGNAPPTPICNTIPECVAARGGADAQSLGGANMRLRVEPTFNVYEDIKIKMQVDVLDNIVLGSTPDGFPTNPNVPLSGFSQTQIPPDSRNSLTDSVRFKRVWAEIMTPLGQLRVGRMPSHFGMGLLANDGRGVDNDHGDSNDRILFATKIAGHYIIPAFDWTVSGPSSARLGVPQGQPFDRDQRDDVDQYILAIAKKDKDDEIKEMLENDEVVLNYGVYGVYREQAFDAGTYYQNSDPTQQPGRIDLVARSMNLWAYSVWAKLMWRKLEVEFEHVGIIGDINNPQVAGTFGDSDPKLKVQQFGGALRANYRLLQDSLQLHFLAVFASGDRAPGWGTQPLVTSPGAGAWDGGQQGDDNKISNLRLDPDFNVDVIFWRQLVGTVTDALVFRPGIQYNVTQGLGARLDLVYSRSIYAQSTPSGGINPSADFNGDQSPDGVTPSKNLGLEADLKIFYASEDGFHAWLEYALFIPFSGLDRQIEDENTNDRLLEASVAQTIQAMLAVTF